MFVVRIGKEKKIKKIIEIICISFGELFEDICFTNLLCLNSGCANSKENVKMLSLMLLIIEYCIVFLFKTRATEKLRNMSTYQRADSCFVSEGKGKGAPTVTEHYIRTD